MKHENIASFVNTAAEANALTLAQHHKTTGVIPPGTVNALAKRPVWQHAGGR